MKLFQSGLLSVVAGICLVVLFIATQSSADDPAQNAQKGAPAVGTTISAQLLAIQQRRLEADRFVRDFENSPLSVDVERELKITDEQSERMLVILNRVRRDPNAVRRLPSLFPAAGLDEASAKRVLDEAEAGAVALERAKKDILAILSPEQVQRMQQIQFQSRLRLSGMADGLAREAKSLGLTANQLAQMRDLEKSAQEQFQKELAELREQQRQRLAEARKKVLSALTPEQKAEYEKLVGPPLEIDDRQLEYGVAGISARTPIGSFGRSRGTGGFGGVGRGLPEPPAAPPPADPKP